MRALLFASGLVALMSLSCTTITVYRGPIEALSKGTITTRTAISTLSNDVNELTVKNRAWVAASKGARFGDRELAPLIAPAFIKARTGGILMIERLATQMLRVVDDTTGTAASTQVVELAADVKAFAEGIDKKGPVKDYAAPLGGLAKVVMDLYSDQDRQLILQKAIQSGVPAAKAVLSVLVQDFKPGSPTNVEAVKREELRTLKVEQINAYDRLLSSESGLSEAERGTLARVEARYAVLARIIATQRALDQSADDAVYQTLVSLDASLDALLHVASKPSVRDQDLKSLVDQLAVFSSNAVSLLDAVRAIKEASPTHGAP